MKIKGKKITGVNVEVIPIPRGNGADIILKARAVMDTAPFDKMCPIPTPPLRKIDGVDVPQLKDRNYLTQVTRHSERRLAWLIITSLEATEGLEWEMVKADDPSSWIRVREELKAAGFNAVEVQRIIATVIGVNSLSEVKIEAARERFLLSEQVQEDE